MKKYQKFVNLFVFDYVYSPSSLAQHSGETNANSALKARRPPVSTAGRGEWCGGGGPLS